MFKREWLIRGNLYLSAFSKPHKTFAGVDVNGPCTLFRNWRNVWIFFIKSTFFDISAGKVDVMTKNALYAFGNADNYGIKILRNINITFSRKYFHYSISFCQNKLFQFPSIVRKEYKCYTCSWISRSIHDISSTRYASTSTQAASWPWSALYSSSLRYRSDRFGDPDSVLVSGRS